MNEFKNYHPIVNFSYFLFAMIFTCVFLHPAMLCISLLCAVSCFAICGGAKNVRRTALSSVCVIVGTAIVNSAFNHEGATIIFYLPSGNPFTAESVYFGLASGAMLCSAILFMSCFNRVMTSDKFIYLFGRVAPSLSLILSMTLRFVPLFKQRYKAAAVNRKCAGCEVTHANIIKRAEYALSILSAVTTQCLENAAETADSMLSRGYGLSGRSAFSIFTLTKRDKTALFCIFALSACVIVGAGTANVKFSYFPFVGCAPFTIFTFTVLVSYFLLLSIPVIIELCEVIKWKFTR